jgi:hypothetical protein
MMNEIIESKRAAVRLRPSTGHSRVDLRTAACDESRHSQLMNQTIGHAPISAIRWRPGPIINTVGQGRDCTDQSNQ